MRDDMGRDHEESTVERTARVSSGEEAVRGSGNPATKVVTVTTAPSVPSGPAPAAPEQPQSKGESK